MRAAIYARYSAGPNQTEISIEGQVAACKKYLKEKNYLLGNIYADEHVTGKTDRRPEFQKMIADAEAGAFDVLVVYTIDRFSRGEYDLPYYRMVLNKAGVKLESAAERIPDSPEGVLLGHVLDGLAIYYSLELSRKIKRGMNTKAEKAIPIGGPTPFGYRLKDKSYIIEEREAGALRHVFDMAISGKTVADCTRYLNGLGFRTNQGNPFNASHLKRMLLNRKYTGVYKYGDLEIEGGMPAIIEKEVFEMAQEKLEIRPHSPRGEFALTGKLICGKCGSKMRGTSGTGKGGKKYYYYKCNSGDIKNIPRDTLEHTIAEHIREVLMSPQELDILVDKVFALQEKNKDSGFDRALLEARVKKIGKQIDRLLDEWLDEEDSRIKDKIKELSAEEKDLKRRLSDTKPKTELTKREIKKGLVRSFSIDMTDAELDQELVQQVILREDGIFVLLNLLDGDDYKAIDFSCSTNSLNGGA